MTEIERTAELLSKFPNIGKKTALRLVYFLLKASPKFAIQLGTAIQGLHEHIIECSVCGNFSEHECCEICSNPQRDASLICVVAQAQDIFALENSQSYNALYHVLGGLLSPLNGIGPDQLRLQILKQRIFTQDTKEVILATCPSIEGETTARYIAKVCYKEGCNFTRIAQGMPIGGDFEYTDKYTLAQSLKSRTNLEMH